MLFKLGTTTVASVVCNSTFIHYDYCTFLIFKFRPYNLAEVSICYRVSNLFKVCRFIKNVFNKQKKIVLFKKIFFFDEIFNYFMIIFHINLKWYGEHFKSNFYR